MEYETTHTSNVQKGVEYTMNVTLRILWDATKTIASLIYAVIFLSLRALFLLMAKPLVALENIVEERILER